MTQRALVIAALAEGPSEVVRPLLCDDAHHLSGLLEAMGVGVEREEGRWRVTPAPLVAPAAAQVLGNAGTAVRFGSCLSLLCEGPLTIDGNEHMRRRPLGPLTAALQSLGVDARFLARDGCPPVRLERRGEVGAEVRVDGTLSSQYASGLLMVAPRLPRGLVLHLTGALVSQPYLDMTVAMMQRAGAEIGRDGRTITVAPRAYRGGELAVEVDWSGAAFLLAAGFVLERPVEVPGLPASGSLQGDAVFADFLTELHAPGPSTFDLTAAPDLIAPLAAAALFAKAPSSIVGAAHTRVKECDRVAVLASELAKVGATIEARDDGLEIEPLTEPRRPDGPLDPHDDHRMAMAFGIVGLRAPLEIRNPGCVSKSFPDFFDVIAPLQEASA